MVNSKKVKLKIKKYKYHIFVGNVTLNNISDDSLDVNSKGKDKYQRKMTKIRLEEESKKQVN